MTGEILDLKYSFKGVGNNSCLIDLWDLFEICSLKIEFFKELFPNFPMNKRTTVILMQISTLRLLFVAHFPWALIPSHSALWLFWAWRAILRLNFYTLVWAELGDFWIIVYTVMDDYCLYSYGFLLFVYT